MKTIGKSLTIIVFLAIIAPISFALGVFLWGLWYDEWSGFNASFYVSDGFCNIGVVTVYGDILPYPDPEYVSTTPFDLRSFFSKAQQDEYVRGVLLEIDSLGGYPAASAFASDEVKASTLPTVALIGDYGTSGGYLIASAADHIIASPFSDVGSIAVTMSYLNNVVKNEREGLEYISLTSAPLKDIGSPDKELTAQERALLERDLSLWHDEFVRMVAQNRALPVEAVSTLADGASMPSSLALQHKLIDQIGNRETAKQYFAELLGIPNDEVIFCEAQRMI